MIVFKKNSLYTRICLVILCCIIPINIILFAYTIYSKNIIELQAYENYNEYANLISNQIDFTLDKIQMYMSNIYIQNTNLSLLASSNNNNVKYKCAFEITDDVDQYIESYKTPMLFFIKVKDLKIPAVYNNKKVFNDPTFSDYIQSLPNTGDQYLKNKYILLELNNKRYISILFEKANIYFGLIIPLESLLENLNFSNSSTAITYFSDKNGSILTSLKPITNSKTHYITIHTDLEKIPITLTIQIPEKNIIGHLSLLNRISIIMLSVSLLSLLSILLLVRKQLYLPLMHLKFAITEIQQGDLTKKVELVNNVVEINEVYETFNLFMDNILNLKMQAYEEKLAKQQTEMQYLRLQLRPHFFLNSLKSIYALAQHNKNSSIQEYVLCLSNHYRFLIYDTTEMISLKDELIHVQNYIQLQRIGHDLPIQCILSINPNITYIEVPALVLLTFIENSIKYATISNKVLQLNIEANVQSIEELSVINITIRDNGPGFSPEIINSLSNNKDYKNTFFDKHIGFGNLMRRLSFIYGDQVSFYLYNNPQGGANVELLLPYQQTNRNEGEE